MNNTLDLKFKIKLDDNKKLSGFLRLSEKELKKLTAEVNKFSKDSKTAFSKPSKDLGLMSQQLSTARNLLIGFFSVRAAAGFLTGLVDTNREMKTLRAQLKSLTGSNSGSAKAFGFIQDFAEDTPFQVQGLTKNFIQLQNFGIQPTAKVVESLTNQASKLGASQETLSSIVRQLGQAYSKGKLQQEDMVVLAERGVPVYQILSEELGKTTAEIFKMSEKGEITRDVIDRLIVTMGELASGANADAMDTLNGKISNLSDSWARFEDTLLNDKSEGLIKSFVQSVGNVINTFTRSLDDSIGSQITTLEKRIENFKSLGAVGGFVGDLTGFDINDSKNLLDHLVKQRNLEQEKSKLISDQTKAKRDQLKTEEAISLKLSESSKKAFDFAARQNKLAEAAIASLQRDIALRDDSSTKAAVFYDVTLGRLKSISALEKQQLLVLAEKKDAIKAAADEYEEYNDIVKAGLELAKKQRDDEQGLRERLTDKFKTSEIKLNQGIGDVSDAKDLGIINEQEAKALYDKLGKAFNDSFIDPSKDGLINLQALSEQAARNMQDQFADFLFDPFSEGLDGMLIGFLDVIRRMAAELASEQIFKLVSDSASSATGAGGILAGLFHDGGVVGSGGSNIAVSPLVFSGAQRFHGGGFPGLKSDEVPAILQTGERVLSRKEVAAGAGGSSGSSVYNITVNVTSREGESSSRTGQKVAEALARNIAKQEIEKASRIGNRLNSKTKFA